MNEQQKREATEAFVSKCLAKLVEDGAKVAQPILCKACNAPLYVLFAPSLGISLNPKCPVCDGEAVSEMRRLHLSARMGGGVFVAAEEAGE